MHVGDPVPQAVEDQPAHHRVVRVQRVAGAGVVRVARAVGFEEVVRVVVEAAERQRGSVVVPFRGVVVDDVQDHLDARAVQRLDEVPELVDRSQRVATRAVAGVGGEERDGGIAPIVHQTRWAVLRVELEHRQQLDRGDPEVLEIGNLLDHAGIRPARSWRDARARMPREARDVHLVDHRGGERPAERRVALPVVEVGIHHHAPHGDRRVVARTARRRAVVPVRDDDGAPVGVEEDLRGIEAEPVRRVERGRWRGTRRPVPSGGRARTRASSGRSGAPVRRAGSRGPAPCASASSKSRSSTASALRENTQKLTPPSTTLAPSGKVRPGETVTASPNRPAATSHGRQRSYDADQARATRTGAGSSQREDRRSRSPKRRHSETARRKRSSIESATFRASLSARSAALLRSPQELSAALDSRLTMRLASRWCPRRIASCARASWRSLRTRPRASASIFRSAWRSETSICLTDRASWWTPFWTSTRPS